MVKHSPWWQSELKTLESYLLTRLRSKFPALRQDHDDLVADTLEGLARYVRRSVDVPETWHEQSAPPDADRAAYYRLAYAILNRRLTDLFRKRWPRLTDPVWFDALAADDAADSHGEQLDLAHLLRVCMELIGELDADDRQLMHEVATGANAPLSPRARQRLRRLRGRLRDNLERRVGSSVAQLLRE